MAKRAPSRNVSSQTQKKRKEATDQQSAHALQGTRSKKRQRIQYAKAARENDVVVEGGTWQQAAAYIARSDASVPLPLMPPSFAALHEAQCLEDISHMYSFLQNIAWHTCVVCWRAWYVVDMDFPFRQAAARNINE